MGTVVHSGLLGVELVCRKIAVDRWIEWVASPSDADGASRMAVSRGEWADALVVRRDGRACEGSDMCSAAVLSASWYCQNDVGIAQCYELRVDRTHVTVKAGVHHMSCGAHRLMPNRDLSRSSECHRAPGEL